MKTFTKIRKMLIVILLSVFAFTQTQALCDYEIALYDDWGDGWNGGTVSVYVDGSVVLNNITLGTGSGPEYYTFQITTGAEIITVYTPGDWSYENEYYIIDAIGTVVWVDCGDGTTPTGIGTGLLYGNCPSSPGAFEGYVMNGQGLSISEADVYVEPVPVWSAVTNTTGYYIISDVQPATWNVVASRVGYWNDTASVTVISNDTVQQDFILTRPQVTITPLLLNAYLHPNQTYTDFIGILNTGDGLLLWNAVIVYYYDGESQAISVPAFTGEVEKVRHQNSTGLAPEELTKQGKPGEIYQTDNFRGSVAFGYQAVGTDEFVNFDIDDVSAYTVIANATTPDFVTGVAYPVGEEDFVYGVVYGSSNLYEIDVTTGTWTDLGSMGVTGFNDMTVDPTSGAFYVATDDNLYIIIIEANSPSAILIGAFTNSNEMIGIVCDGDGNLWGYDIGNDNFYSIDKNTGLATVIGSLGFNASYAQCAFYDPETEQVLLGAFNAGNNYCEIRAVDVTTGASVILSSVYYKEMTAAAIPVGSGGWLSLCQYSGMVSPDGGTWNLKVNYNAQGFATGNYLTAEIIFTFYPDVGTITVPVSMTVFGDTLNMPYNLVVTLINEITGEVYLTWDIDGNDFQYFIVFRNGVLYATTTNQFCTDFLPDYGEYCYTVVAVYDQGQTAPAGPECIEWSNPIMVIDPMSLYGTVWPNHTVMVSTNISNTGIGSLSYAFPDFDTGDGLFITSVLPSSGILVPGESVDINITYDATGFDPGLYSEWLYIESNDPNRLYDSIFNETLVYTPAQFAGTVTDGNTGIPISGVEVTADQWQTTTADGTYSLYVDPGTYDVYFEKIAYQDVVVYDTSALAGIVTPLDVQMFEEAYPPAFVLATVNEDDTECLVVWGLPAGPYEIIYEDGSADDYFVWSTMGNANAVKFTPAGYPATVIGGKIYVGDGSFPVGANFIGTTFGVVVYDDDGVGGLPGTQLDSISVYVDNYGWVDFSGLYATIDDGDFFIAMFQGGLPPNTAPLGIDYTTPTVYRSYSYDAVFDIWTLSAYQDFMIRAIVSGPQSDDDMAESTEIVYPTKPLKQNFITIHAPKGIPGTVKSGEYRPITDGPATNRDVVCYTFARLSNFDPNGSPLSGDTAVLATGLTAFSYHDVAFGGLPMGWYAYCVRAHYTNGDVSDCAVSNIVGHLMDAQFIINVSLITGGNPEGAEVTLCPYDYPYVLYIRTMDTTGIDTIECVWKGYYDICVFKPGYELYCIETYIFSDTTININLEEKKYSPYNLYVDSLTSIAIWNEPKITALKEDFNGALFPPSGWTSETQGLGWFATSDGSSSGFQIPENDSQYACDNDDAAGNNNGCCDYLITPPLDLRESEGYSLKFESYYTGANEQLAYIEYSNNEGTTWEVIDQLSPASTWVDIEVDLSSFSGMTAPASIWLAFHSDDQGNCASGWAIDNVEVSVGNDECPPLGYHVFLDDNYIATTQETTYQYQNLTYGVEYEASVAALYYSGLSEKDYYTFTSVYLVPPYDLQGMIPVGTDYVYLIWETPLEPADYVVVSEKPVTYQQSKNVEYSPTVRMIKDKGHGRDQWDVQFNFPVGGVGSEVGIESDGNYIYTSQRDAGNGTFFKYELDGTFLGSFVIPGCQDLCDLAYDGAHFFGSNATTSVWEMDFETQTVVSTIFAPIDCSAIAYDEQFDGFWCNNWSTDIILFDKNGTQINSFPVGAFANFHGFAYDDWSPGGPFLWGFSQDGAGSEIVQMDLATGAQIFNFNVLPLVGGSGIAGGLFSHCELIEPNLATLGGLLLSELIFGLELAECGNGGIIPENLLGFKIYRNGEYQDYIESMPDSLFYDWYDVTVFYPGIYEYTVTALYDLEPYGFPGDTAESMEEGPVTVIFDTPLILPFFEDWSNGNFEFNDWTTECDNWQINIQTGNPLPSAEFHYDPVLTNYECSLVSYTLPGSDIIDGEIFLDFDIMLDSWVDTAIEEKMIVKVWENDTWNTIIEFINEGDMDWTSNHINISEFAKGNYFRLGFFATGLNSADILGWYIDNIHVYRVCLPPFDMTAEMEWYISEIHVYLNWIAPYAMQGEWLSYNDGTFENALSSTEGGAGLAQVFTPPQYPCTITQVRFFVSGYNSYYQDEEVYVLTGDGATILTGPYVVSGLENDWVTVDIDDVTIAEGTFMVATFNVLPDGPFIGMDDGYYDATLYFGSIGDFTELGEYGYFCIGSHEAYVEYETSDNVVVNSVLSRPKPNDKRSDIVMSNTFSDGTKRPDRDLLGFNIFRSISGGEFNMINEELILEASYIDTVYTNDWFCYYTTAVYDQCESGSSDTACTPITSIEELSIESSINIYPNPAKDFINIISTENINKITVINFAGQKVFEKKVSNETNIMLNTASYETGVYIIKIETENGITAKRITITR